LISQRVREGAARAKSRGVKLGNRKNLKVAQRGGAVSNMVRADRKVQELADFIERTPGWNDLTLKEKVELLNSTGPLNLVSEKRGERKSWTESSVRKPLKKVAVELDLRNQMADQMRQIGPASSPGDGDFSQVSSSVTVDPDLSSDNANGPLELAYKNHPEFGKF
jgi:hypothetical protein